LKDGQRQRGKSDQTSEDGTVDTDGRLRALGALPVAADGDFSKALIGGADCGQLREFGTSTADAHCCTG